MEYELKLLQLKEMANDAISNHGNLIIYYWISEIFEIKDYIDKTVWIDMIYYCIFEYLEESEQHGAFCLLSSATSFLNQTKDIKKDTYLYIIYSNETKRTKIGITNNPKHRNRTISSHENGISMTNLYRFADRKDAQAIESKLHKKLKDSRICGEWFNVQPIIASEALADLLIEDQIGYQEVNPVCVNSCQIVIENKARMMIK